MEVRGIIRLACFRFILDIFWCVRSHADPGVCKGADTISKVVLDIFTACWYGSSHVAECVRQPAVGQCDQLRMDQRGQSLDVWRTARHAEQGEIAQATLLKMKCKENL